MQMEKKEAPSTKPVGVCEKLFNALSMGPAFRPLRRISHPSQPPPAAEPSQPLPLSTPPVSSCTTCHGSESKPPAVQKPVPITDSNHAPVPKKSDVAEVVPTKTKPVRPSAPQLPPPEEKPKPVTGPLGTLMAETSPAKPKPPPPSAPLPQPTVAKTKPVTGPLGGHVIEVAPVRGKPGTTEVKMKTAVPPPSSTREKAQLPRGNTKVQSAVPPVSAGEKEKLANKAKVASSPGAVKGQGDAKVPPPTATPTATGDINADTTSYIARAKMKIRAMSGKPSV